MPDRLNEEGTTEGPVKEFTLLTDTDIHLFWEGRHCRLFEKFGSHPLEVDGEKGTYFAVWAPNAKKVSVIGGFNHWNPKTHVLGRHDDTSGVWEGFISGVDNGAVYKYHVASKVNGYTVDKGDPFAYHWEVPPKTASVVSNLAYDWGDDEWMRQRAEKNSLTAAMAIYEVHLGSWRRVPEDKNRWLSYSELAGYLPDYASGLGFTHVELLPVMEHPFYGSWGYQTTGFFAPTSRYGKPREMMRLVDALHRKGVESSSTGCPPTFRLTSTGSPISTAHTSSNTATLGRVSNRTGRPTSSTSAGTR